MDLSENTTRDGKPYIQFDSNKSLPLNEHCEDKGLCLYEICLRVLGGTINTTRPTLPQKGVSERGGQAPETKNRCMLMSGNNTPEEVPDTEAKRQYICANLGQRA